MANTTLLWLFDLDNTLHDASHAIFPAIHDNMNAYMARALGVDGVGADAATVNATRIDYWKRYGATLLGMVRHHRVCPEEFLREAHRFNDLPGMIWAEPGLRTLLKRLPGRKILLTNAPYHYSRDVLRHLRLHHCFDRHITIEKMQVHRQLKPKPSRQMLRKLISQEQVPACRCVLVEDTLTTLKAAKRVGMRTVWVTQYLANTPNLSWIKRAGYVDIKIASVRRLRDHLHRLCSEPVHDLA